MFFGLQHFIVEVLIGQFQNEFFNLPKKYVVSRYKHRMDTALGPDSIPVDHIEALHDLGYLPLEICALPEGSFVPEKIPVLTIINTRPEFAWLTNYMETMISACLWKSCTSATISAAYKQLLMNAAIKSGNEGFVQFQGHDFSFRGMSGLNDAALTGVGHLLSFVGTDTVAAIDTAEEYYYANAEQELIGCSVPATEHSVMCMGHSEGEFETFRRLVEELYPKGIVSIVSDSWDFWRVLTDYLPRLKETIMAREGKVVIRPDSGDPVEIICGMAVYPDNGPGTVKPEDLGAIRILWNVFGGTVNEKGYKELDPHIGLIYGDSITLDRADRITKRLMEMAFASTNVVFGIGSYTYQYVTRDTLGFAMKATAGIVKGEVREIFKDPVTDNGLKKSARGFLRVVKHPEAGYGLLDRVEQSHSGGELTPVYRDGKILSTQTLQEIREHLKSELS